MPKITDKTALTAPADGDIIHVVDVSDTTDDAAGSSRKSTLLTLKTWLANFFVTLTSIGKVTIQDTTATTGVTSLEVKAGEGQGTTNKIIKVTNTAGAALWAVNF